jgi:hypothetical protein
MTEDERVAAIRKQIADLQDELSQLERYRYRTIEDKYGRKILMRDDGYRIDFRMPDGGTNIDPEEWYSWAEYKQCDLPGPSADIADALMKSPDPGQ